uniref:Transposase n=1 Tax=Macrostomum lignano TaxID=282301 RepID=A0A1I8F7Z1_9PLAT
MDLPAKAVHIGEATVAACRKGYYRRSAMEAAVYTGQQLGTTTQSPESTSTSVPNGVIAPTR